MWNVQCNQVFVNVDYLLSSSISLQPIGDRCEKCKPGFYDDDCKPCACPLSNPSNNFADSCNLDLDTSELVCKCKPGYTGIRCEKCADGYFGEPTVLGGSCKRCECNGNIDLSLTGKPSVVRFVFLCFCIVEELSTRIKKVPC